MCMVYSVGAGSNVVCWCTMQLISHSFHYIGGGKNFGGRQTVHDHGIQTNCNRNTDVGIPLQLVYKSHAYHAYCHILYMGI